MRLTDRIPGAALVLLAVFYGLEASSFEVGFVADPIGPKAFPYILAMVLGAVGCYLMLTPGAAIAIEKRAPMRVAACFGSLTLYALLLVPLGFVLATTLLITALALLLGGAARGSLLAALVFAVLAFVLFDRILGIPLPQGEVFARSPG